MTLPDTMRAVLLTGYGGVEKLDYRGYVPVPRPGATPETFRQMVGYIEAGKLQPLVEKTYRLDELRAAQVEFVQRRHVGKLVIIP